MDTLDGGSVDEEQTKILVVSVMEEVLVEGSLAQVTFCDRDSLVANRKVGINEIEKEEAEHLVVIEVEKSLAMVVVRDQVTDENPSRIRGNGSVMEDDKGLQLITCGEIKERCFCGQTLKMGD